LKILSAAKVQKNAQVRLRLFDVPMKIRTLTAVVLVYSALAGCAQETTKPNILEKAYLDSATDIFTLRFVYNSCKENLASDGKERARACSDIANVSGDDKTKILAIAILNDLKPALQGQGIAPKTYDGAKYLAFMKMQAERYMRGEIGWNEMDYSIIAKGEELSKQNFEGLRGPVSR
jgi:hypothetical protein